MLFEKLSNAIHVKQMCGTPDALGGLGGSLSMRKRAGVTTVDMIARTSICPKILSVMQ
jgi:hypothetical protein